MGTTYAIGSDGNCTLPSDYAAQIQTWSCNITRTTQVLTGFGNTGQVRKQSTLCDITGSAAGIPKYNASSTAPFPIGTGGDAGKVLDTAGGAITLFILDANLDGAVTSGNDASLTFACVFSSYDFSVEMDGASTVTFNFQMADDDGPTLTWQEA